MKKFTKEFTKAYKKNTKAATKWVSRNPGKAIAINAVGDCGLVAIGAAVAIKAMKKKNPLAIEANIIRLLIFHKDCIPFQSFRTISQIRYG